jgi:hypothetical protein
MEELKNLFSKNYGQSMVNIDRIINKNKQAGGINRIYAIKNMIIKIDKISLLL